MELQGQVGPQRSADGTIQEVRLDKNASVVTTNAQGRYYEACSRGNIFSAANQAAVTSGAGLTTSSVNFTLYNPAGSGVLISLLDIGIGINAAAAAFSVIYLVQNNNVNQAAPSATTSLNVVSNNMSASSGVGKAYSTATLAATPSVLRVLASVPNGTSFSGSMFKDEVSGAVVLQPGAYVSIQSTTAVAMFVHMTWQEISIV